MRAAGITILANWEAGELTLEEWILRIWDIVYMVKLTNKLGERADN